MADTHEHEVPVTDPLPARSEILARIRSANRSGTLTGRALQAGEEWQQIPRSYRTVGSLTETGRIELFAERLREYGAGVYPAQPSDVADTITKTLQKRSKQKILLSSDINPDWLPRDGCRFIQDHALSYADIETCDGVLTGCATAIAITGTLVICHDSAHGRRALTLLPDYHLCIVEASKIVETVPQGVRALEAHRVQPITFVSGPSATADIEMTRIQGVHGPRLLDVVIVEEPV
jgi:L-lactate dehydrogenase complex protein LldG